MYGDLPILRKDHTDTELTTTKTVAIIVLCILNVFMCLGNSISILTILGIRKLRTNVSYWFVLNLAVIDLLISLTVVPLNTVWEYYGTYPMGTVMCYFVTFADVCFSTISAYAVVLVSIDKYLYVTYAIHYYTTMTKRTAVVLIILVWTLVIIFALVSVLTKFGEDTIDDHILMQTHNTTSTCVFIMTDAYILPSAFISFFTPFVILCFTSSKIVCTATIHIRKIQSASKLSVSCTDSEISCQKPLSTTCGSKLSVVTTGLLTASTNNALPVASCSRLKHSASMPEIYHMGNQIETSVQQKNNILEIDSTRKTRTEIHVHKNTILSQTCNTYGNDTRTHTVMSPTGDQLCGQRTIPCITINSAEDTGNDVEIDTNLQTSTDKNNRHRTVSQTLSENVLTILRQQKPYCKLFGTVTIVIACFVLMYAPYYIASVVDMGCHCVSAWVYEDVLVVLYYMHSLVNPYIYIATDRKYRSALKRFWRRKCHLQKPFT